ncbi:DUF4188 domain-containing protein [Tumebacillus flagellatus]|uniref:Transcriptional regulator n=1 Tax=Tumebacillus flagellatus TaxID=1157490 RepID=A0A074LMF5_9BACL|nr:DUF4188 domain-containing protein [Tumebacillus flagellatus]KEO82294.1 transcriptional regulator [Tumebacillus flagellatus]
MKEIFKGRYTVQSDEPFVLFLIGLRVNKLWAVHKWLPVARAMFPMMTELYTNEELGFLDSEVILYWRGIGVVQYWRSFELLERYAHMEKHLKAWQDFHRKVGLNSDVVGIWHETYLIEPGKFETLYGNMPHFGLGKALKDRHVQTKGPRHETAYSRVHGHDKEQ